MFGRLQSEYICHREAINNFHHYVSHCELTQKNNRVNQSTNLSNRLGHLPANVRFLVYCSNVAIFHPNWPIQCLSHVAHCTVALFLGRRADCL